jgi:hypothetical protein
MLSAVTEMTHSWTIQDETSAAAAE